MSICTFCVRTKHIQANAIHVLEAFIQCYCQNSEYALQLQKMNTICCRCVWQPMCLLMLFRYYEIHFHP